MHGASLRNGQRPERTGAGLSRCDAPSAGRTPQSEGSVRGRAPARHGPSPANRKQLLTSGIAKPRNQEEQQIVQQAQMAAQNQPNPEMVLAQAQMVAAEAENKKADNATRETVIKAFTAQQDAQESQANVVYKLSQAQNINKKGGYGCNSAPE
ncbi:portal protein [Streptomyces sp. NPDC047968]|uniref:portal protein n=1 Tax=Streptomyces sp. NPDC047968 TaxID=3155382 RepID=UPI003435F739